MRVSIDGYWTAKQFSEYFEAMDNLYGFLVERSIEPASFGRVFAFTRFTGFYDRRFDLAVEAVKFSSPGFTDFVGLGAIMKELREFLQFAISYWSERHDREISRDKARLEVAMLRVELLSKLLDVEERLGSKLPLGAVDAFGLTRGPLPNIDPILEAILDGRIKKVSGENTSKLGDGEEL